MAPRTRVKRADRSGEQPPVEVTRIKRDLRTIGDDSIETGTWLAAAMEGTWDAATMLLGYPQLAELLGDRHRIIASDWHAASMSSLAGRSLHRSVDLLDRIDFTPAALRADLAGDRTVPHYLCSAVELIDHAADLLSGSAGLVHDNEPRWRRFHQRVLSISRPDQPLTGRDRRSWLGQEVRLAPPGPRTTPRR